MMYHMHYSGCTMIFRSFVQHSQLNIRYCKEKVLIGKGRRKKSYFLNGSAIKASPPLNGSRNFFNKFNKKIRLP